MRKLLIALVMVLAFNVMSSIVMAPPMSFADDPAPQEEPKPEQPAE